MGRVGVLEMLSDSIHEFSLQELSIDSTMGGEGHSGYRRGPLLSTMLVVWWQEEDTAILGRRASKSGRGGVRILPATRGAISRAAAASSTKSAQVWSSTRDRVCRTRIKRSETHPNISNTQDREPQEYETPPGRKTSLFNGLGHFRTCAAWDIGCEVHSRERIGPFRGLQSLPNLQAHRSADVHFLHSLSAWTSQHKQRHCAASSRRRTLTCLDPM